MTELEAVEKAGAAFERLRNDVEYWRQRCEASERDLALQTQAATLAHERAEQYKLEAAFYSHREASMRSALEAAYALLGDRITTANNERPPVGRAAISLSPEGEAQLRRHLLPHVNGGQGEDVA